MADTQKQALRRRWTPEQLTEIWDFCQHDFARFLKLLVWLDRLKGVTNG